MDVYTRRCHSIFELLLRAINGDDDDDDEGGGIMTPAGVYQGA